MWRFLKVCIAFVVRMLQQMLVYPIPPLPGGGQCLGAPRGARPLVDARRELTPSVGYVGLATDPFLARLASSLAPHRPLASKPTFFGGRLSFALESRLVVSVGWQGRVGVRRPSLALRSSSSVSASS